MKNVSVNTEERRSPCWLEEKEKINEPLFCEEFVKKRPLLCINGKFFGYDGAIGDSVISHEISEMIIEHIKVNIARKTSTLLDALKLYCYSEPLPVKEDEIHLLNGVLKTDGTFIPGKRFCTNRLNIEYNTELLMGYHFPDKFFAFLMELLDMDDITTLQEYLGYCLIPSTKGQTALFIVGNGGEGKSRISVILREIFGSAMLVAHFQKLETNNFFTYNLQNKLLMVDDDMQMNALSSTGVIKNLITAETPVEVEAKGQQSVQADIYCRFICLGNGSPKALYDKSDGFARRLLILKTKPIPKGRVNNPYIADEFIAEKEKIFFWIFEGLQRLIRNNFQFTLSEKAKLNAAEVMSDNCNIIEFMSDENYISFGEKLEATSTDMYGGYVHWCGQNGLTAMKRDSFIGWLKSNSEKYGIRYDTNVINKDGKRVRGFKGIRTSFVHFVV